MGDLERIRCTKQLAPDRAFASSPEECELLSPGEFLESNNDGTGMATLQAQSLPFSPLRDIPEGTQTAFQSAEQHTAEGYASIVERDTMPRYSFGYDPEILGQSRNRPHPCAVHGHVLYTHHSFLKNNDFTCTQARDLRLLETEGCLHVPISRAFDDFVHKYFVYVHPLLPIVDEAAFWRAYEGDQNLGREGAISLVLIQAMLFASSHVRQSLALEAGSAC